MLIASLVLFALLIAWFVYENFATKKARASFLHIIHVNGIRGKTTTCRLLDAHLRHAGYRVFTKTTGSTPCTIGVSGEEKVLRRFGSPNVIEQAAMLRRARREGAEIVILECMAVAPELQKIAQHEIVRADYVVITNVRYDHVLEMGNTLPEIAESLSATVPEKGVLFTADEAFFPFFEEKCRVLESEAVLCTPDGELNENMAIAAAVGEKLGIPKGELISSLSGYHEDFGTRKCYRGEKTFLNLFSANDPTSSLMLLKEEIPEGEPVTFLYNHRADRPDRLVLFIKHFFPNTEYDKIIVIGEARGAALRWLKRNGISRAETAKSWREALTKSNTHTVVGIGNIKGEAYKMVEEYEKGDAE